MWQYVMDIPSKSTDAAQAHSFSKLSDAPSQRVTVTFPINIIPELMDVQVSSRSLSF